MRLLRFVLSLALSLLLLDGCATTSRVFVPLDVCGPSSVAGTFVCRTDSGDASVPWAQASDLVCFHASAWKSYNETCHQP